MSNPWFRLYAEFAHDPKVQMLSEVMQRRYVMLMCMRCSNALVTLQETEIAFHLRISDEELASTKTLFIAKGFIDSEWNLPNWDKRQFASDSSAARVAKHRALKKQAEQEGGNGDVTLLQRQANALDTDTDTDTDKKDSPAVAAKKTSRKSQIPADFKPNDAGIEAAESAGLNVNAEIRKFIDFHEGKGSVMASWQAAWRTWVGKAIEFGRGKPAKPSGEAAWLAGTPFTDTFEAHNAGCFSHNVAKFRTGAPA